MVGCTSAAGSRPKPHPRLQRPSSGGLVPMQTLWRSRRVFLLLREMEMDASLKLSGEGEVDHGQSTWKHTLLPEKT